MASKYLLLGATLLGVAGGAQLPPQHTIEDSKDVIQELCRTGMDVKSVKGSVWLKAKSKEASGQFPAQVAVESSDQLRMEVTNLVGGTEAVISVKGSEYVIDIPKKKNRLEKKGVTSWGGIPLRWANELFSGRVPCPDASRMSEWKVTQGEKKEEIIVELPSASGDALERYLFQIKNHVGKPWPEALSWQRAENGLEKALVEFKFADPEDSTRSPRRWEAKSPDGEVKVRWKDRQVQVKE